ncbi:MAG: aminopeptidase P family protein [Rhodobacteraceae bacterium]|jgi:Xaa-Pro aminopeptidase|nr:aminopeptidase P family protein [Paracoccaceae bacterium]
MQQAADTAASLAQVFKDDRKRTYLNPEGADRPLRSPLGPEVLDRARRYRIARLREKLREHDCGAILLYDPVNIRYAFDSSNQGVWTSHNASRYALVVSEGPGIMWEFSGCEHLNHGLPAVDEIRPARNWTYVFTGEHVQDRAALWADEIVDILRAQAPNLRLAVDKLEPLGTFALQARGVEIVEGQELTERARAIKSADEIALMRWTIRVCEAGMARMYEISEPGRMEREIWAELHYENARSGGEWLETKIFSAGPRTNPWFQECSDYIVQRGDMISFDTDMIGPYGYCADLSRSWTCGHVRMTPQQRGIYAAALDQIGHNLALIRPGLSFVEFNDKAWRIPEKYRPYRYPVCIHGVGMADEWPIVLLHPDFHLNHGGSFEAGMVVCVESLIAEEGSESIKLETQVLITQTGAERLDSFPWEPV